MTRLWHLAASFPFAATIGTMSAAQTSPFGAGWGLQAEASSLQFQSIKHESSIETSSFATMSGAFGPVEAEGDFSVEACVGRFEILSRTDVQSNFGSAQLQQKAFPLLDSVADIVNRCPDLNIVIAGHTDSIGDRNYNQRLSEQRAASVVDYLTGKGVGAGRMSALGFGEDRPIATTTPTAVACSIAVSSSRWPTADRRPVTQRRNDPCQWKRTSSTSSRNC